MKKSEKRDLNPQPWQGYTLPLSYFRITTELEKTNYRLNKVKKARDGIEPSLQDLQS